MNESNGEIVDNESEGNELVSNEEMIEDDDDDDVVEETKENVLEIGNSNTNPMINNYLHNEQHADSHSNNTNLNRKQSHQSLQRGFCRGTNDEMSMNIELNNKNEFVGMEHFDEASKVGFGIAEDDNISILRFVPNSTKKDNNDNVAPGNTNQTNTTGEKEMICEDGEDDVIKQKLETKLHLDDPNILYYEIQNFKTWKKFINGKIRFFLPGENNKHKLYSKKIVSKKEVSGFKKLAQKKKGKQPLNKSNLTNSAVVSNNNNSNRKSRQISEVNLNEDIRPSVGDNCNDDNNNNNINTTDYGQILKENEDLRQRNIDLVKTIEHLEKELNIIKQSIMLSSSSSPLQPSSANVVLNTNNKHYIENERYNQYQKQ